MSERLTPNQRQMLITIAAEPIKRATIRSGQVPTLRALGRKGLAELEYLPPHGDLYWQATDAGRAILSLKDNANG